MSVDARLNVGGPVLDPVDDIRVTTVRHEVNSRLPDLIRQVLGRGATSGVWLDLGCGDGSGYELVWRAGLRGQYVGIDLAPGEHDEHSTLSHTSLSCRFVACDAADVDRLLGRAVVDGAVSISAFEHFSDDAAALAAVRAVLRPGAALLLCVPAPAGRVVWGPRHGFRWYRPRQLNRLARSADMVVERLEPVGGLATLVLGLVWAMPAYLASKVVRAALVLRHGGSRATARRRHAWSAHTMTMLQFAHCATPQGRRAHVRVLRAVNAIDRAARRPPAAWIAVLRVPNGGQPG